MPEIDHLHPLIRNAGEFTTWRRHQLGWSAAVLAVACEEFAQSQQPPLPSSMNRNAISKVENGRRGLGAEEIYLIAGALGVSMVAMLTNNTEGITADTPPGVIIDDRTLIPHNPLAIRVATLEKQMFQLHDGLGLEPHTGSGTPE
jgi:transcriptional regulator with XRE-family HTH domain